MIIKHGRHNFGEVMRRWALRYVGFFLDCTFQTLIVWTHKLWIMWNCMQIQKNANVLGHIPTWCPCQDSVPWHWKECCSYTVVPKTTYIFPFNLLRCCQLVTTATSNHRETCKKHGTDEILCKQVPVSGYGAWILTLERVHVSGYRAHVFVRAPLKCYVHICTHAQAPNPGPSLDRTLTNIFTLGVVVQSQQASGSYSIIMHDAPDYGGKVNFCKKEENWRTQESVPTELPVKIQCLFQLFLSLFPFILLFKFLFFCFDYKRDFRSPLTKGCKNTGISSSQPILKQLFGCFVVIRDSVHTFVEYPETILDFALGFTKEMKYVNTGDYNRLKFPPDRDMYLSL